MDNTIHSDLIRGHIDTIILKALYDGDRYGFDIIKEIEQKSSGQYIIKQPTLYSCLKRLEVQGFIKSYWGAKSSGGRRKYFTLTDMGRDLFIKNQSEWVYSRSVIDKLISDKDFDFASVAAVAQNQENVNAGNENATDNAEFISAETNEPADDASEESDSAHEFENEESNFSSADPIENSEEDVQPESETPYIPDRPYLDTTAIMNEMFERQLRDGSYTDKLKNEEYVPTESFNANTYFNDSFMESSAARAVVGDEETDYDDTDEIIKRVDASRSNSMYTPSPISSTRDEDQMLAVSDSESQPPAPEPPKAPDFYRYDTTIPSDTDENSLVIKREYKNMLMQLRDKNIVDNMSARSQADLNLAPQIEDTRIEPSEETTLPESTELTLSEMSEDKIQDYKIRQIENELKELGDGVKIRKHSNTSSKEYTNTFYYYSNKLMLSHYLVLFLVMIPEIAITFLAVTLGSSTAQKHSILFLVLSVICALIFPAVAFILNMLNPNQKKRIKFSFKISMIFRFIVMIEALVLVYTINLMLGMPLTFSSEYLVTLLVPGILCTNIPLSAMIFQALYKTNKYNVQG
ncbi:MAG: hypothetical protein HFK09_01245 [Clostridia bacterium]|nr:hypothetical protein [Clostridia bacterium]